ncbi:hypothetical protein [Streptomyces dysideae]|uniref:hypothetical protein n=1 Tax=Streptomyces dysideae TaxID=909626 RepID=UPI000A84CBA9|nr:hypothetical protein [Streptomyces dysideae]
MTAADPPRRTALHPLPRLHRRDAWSCWRATASAWPPPSRRGLSPTKADDFRAAAEFSLDEARIEGEAGLPRGFAALRIRFADGSWIQVGRLGEPEGADHILHTVSA